MLKGPKRNFVVFVDLDLVGVESKAKMFLVQWNNKCSRMKIVFKVTSSLLDEFLVAFHVHVWPYCDIAWSFVAFLWPCMAISVIHKKID